MTKAIVISGSAAILLGAFVILAPLSTHAAAAPNASLGGGNALSRATSGESQGTTRADSSSNILERLSFASTKGGRPAETPPVQENETDDETTTASLPENANENAENNANGNAQGGNGGNGGSSAPGGLIRAGSTVSNSTAVNAINTNVVRINLR